jgi:DNA-binding transcriptional ArsR family regulator
VRRPAWWCRCFLAVSETRSGDARPSNLQPDGVAPPTVRVVPDADRRQRDAGALRSRLRREGQVLPGPRQSVRIRILELLSDGERTVADLQADLSLDASGTSQHLAALRQQGVLDSRRAGTSVYHSIRGPLVSQLTAIANQILTSALTDSHILLNDLAEQPTPRARRR